MRTLPCLLALFTFTFTFTLIAACPSAQAQRSSAAAIQQYRLAAEYQKLEQYDLAAKEWAKLARDYPSDPLAAAGAHYAGVCEFQLGHYEQAIEWLDKFVAQHADHELLEPTLTNLGLAAYNQAGKVGGDPAQTLYEKAVAAFDQRSQKFPDGKLAPEADFYRGEALYALGKTDQAAAAYSKWLTAHGDSPLTPNVRLALGATQTELGQTDEAIATLEALCNANPSQQLLAQALVRLGDAYNAGKQYEAAAERYDRAVEVGGDFADADYARQAATNALFAAGRYADAAESFEKLGDLASAGKAYYQAGDHAQAAERLAKAYAAALGDADLAHWWVRSLLDGGQAEQAVAAADQALAQVKSPVVLLDKADALYSLDARRAESVAAYIAAAEAAEGELAAEARHLAAATALELGDFATAQQQAQAVLQQFADSKFAVDAKLTLAEAQLQSGDAKAAVATFTDLLGGASGQQRGDWSLRLAWALSTAGDEPAVAQTLAPIVDQLTGAAAEQARLLLGRAQYRTDEFAAAVKTLQPVADNSAAGPWAAEAQLVLARAEAASGDRASAIATLTRLVDGNAEPRIAAQAYYRRAELHQQAGDNADALADYGKLSTTWPDHPLAPYADYRAATIAMQDNQLEAAAEGFARLVSEYPDHPLAGEAQLAQASCLERAGKADQALAVLGQMDAGDPRVALARGTSLASQEKWDEAIAVLKSATEAPGDFADRDRAWYELAWAYREAGQAEDSRAAFTTLATKLSDSPLAAEAQFRVGESFYSAEDFAKAAEAFRTAGQAVAESTPLHEKALHLLGWSLEKQGQHPAALEAFRRQLQAYPDGPLAADARWMVGEVEYAAGDYAQALAAYQAAAESKPNAESLAPLGMLHAAQAAGQTDNWQQAADWLQRAIEDYPEYSGRSELDCELGWALTKLGKPGEAMPLLTKVADRDTSPVGARAGFLVGELQFADKQYEPAVRSFFKVAYGFGDRDAPEAYHAWQAESLFEAARCLEQLDRGSAAAKLYAELVERFPQEPKAKLAEKRLAELQP